MIWNGDRDIVSLGKETHVLRLLGCAFLRIYREGDILTLLVP